MKKFFLLLTMLPFLSISAQYNFPIVVNGLSIGLDRSGQQTVFAADFLSLTPSTCSNYGELLINRSTLQFPRGSEPPATASNSIVFNCTDFSTESVELWYQDQFSNWLVADSYVVIFGLQGDCGSCESDCQTTAPTLYNGVSISLGGEDNNATITARELVSRKAATGEEFSFSESVSDSVRTFTCADNSLVPVLVYSHLAGFSSQAASTYIALSVGEDCEDGNFTGAVSKVAQGLSIPNSSAEIITVPARAFALQHSPAQQLSFSLNPLDTLLTLACEQIGAGGIFINVYNHLTGTPGPPALTYITGDDTQNHCGDGPENTAANDSIANAFAVDSCRTFHQFTKASTEEEDVLFLGGGHSVWHFTTPIGQENGASAVFYIDAIDTLKYALFESGFLLDTFFFAIDTGTIVGLDTLIYYDCIINNRSPASTANIYLQISGLAEGATSRYYLSMGQTECPSATTEKNIATLKSYPNPTHEMVNIDLPPGLSSRATISVYDQLGRIVKQQFARNFVRTAKINLTGQMTGIYYVRLSDGEKLWVSKVVLTR